jgi:hypothetical protein
MAKTPSFVGRILQGDCPDWRPLALVVDENLLATFMWMYEVRTPGGLSIHAYKHIDTRDYVHLDHDGNAFAYVGDERYRSIALHAALELALRSWWERFGASPEDVASAWTAILRARRSATQAATPGSGGPWVE